MEDQNYTIKDIARMAGVSAGTVDRVLHNRGDVSPKSKAKVQKVLDEIHYQPNVFAIGLAAKKKYSFLCLIPYYIEHDYWHSVVGGIERARQELRPFNVFWKGKGLTSFQPYASGLFDNPYRVEIGLIEGYVYRFDCSFLGYKDRPYYTIQSDSILYGLPFSSTLQKEVNGLVNNDLKISINPLNINGAFHQHIYKGEMHIKCDSTSTHPTVKRFFGSEQLDFSNPNMNTSVSMTLKRAYYSIQFVTDELAPGDSIKIKAADVAPFYLLYSKDGTSRTEERIISMYDISDYYTAKLKEEETIAFTISYRPANEEKWYSLYTNQSIKMKRNKKNIVKIVKIDEHIGDATISFGEEAEMEESEQEIGK